MKCPYCGLEMEKGCVQSRDGVYWCEKKRIVPALPIGGGKTVKLNNNTGGALQDYNCAQAWLCEKCRKVIIEY